MIASCLLLGGLAVMIVLFAFGFVAIVTWLADVWTAWDRRRARRRRVVDLTNVIPFTRGTALAPSSSPPSSPPNDVEHRAVAPAMADRGNSRPPQGRNAFIHDRNECSPYQPCDVHKPRGGAA